MIISMLYKVALRLLSFPGVLLRRDTAKDAELLVLRRENTVLRLWGAISPHVLWSSAGARSCRARCRRPEL
ncbi:hypothetical protein [Streptomyces sp. NPDC006012]|uniref:hypothetical protein n=1 Tax=Streptomyces sp. NPDC006012 TaxID=3364739 RepID=UPI0036C1DB1B